MALGACASGHDEADRAGAAPIIFSNAPSAPPMGHYSSAVRAGDFIFVSGVLAFDHQTGDFVEAEIEAQTDKAMDNLEAALSSAGASLDDIVKITVYLRSPSDIRAMNAVYESRLGARRPARSLLSGLDWGRDDILIEIDAVAFCRGCD